VNASSFNKLKIGFPYQC